MVDCETSSSSLPEELSTVRLVNTRVLTLHAGGCYHASVTMGTGQQMRALIFEGPGCLTLRRVDRPAVGEGEVLLRVQAAAICGTDLRIVSGRKTRDVRLGHPIGHECAGTVAAVGAGVTGLMPGDRVAVCVVVSCGQCRYCRAGKENLCDTRITLGYHTDGAFAEYMPIPARAVRRGNLFKLPPEVPTDLAPLLEPLACCINGQHEMHLGTSEAGKPESMLIFGAGPIGLLHLLLAKAKGLGPITVVEPMANRRATAAELGADAAYGPEDFGLSGKFDAVILAAGVPDLVNLALSAVERNGTISLFAGFDKDTSVTIDPNMIHYNQVRITGASESRRCDYAEALSLVAQGKLDPAPLLTHRFRLEDYEEAFRVAGDGSALKVVFEM